MAWTEGRCKIVRMLWTRIPQRQASIGKENLNWKTFTGGQTKNEKNSFFINFKVPYFLQEQNSEHSYISLNRLEK